MTKSACLLAGAAVLLLAAGSVGAQPSAPGQLPADIVRGRYLVQTSGCNDCHTPGYASSAGKVDERLWLTGDPLGWQGPWGTTYAANLRLLVKDMTAEEFMNRARSELRPPMPWFNLRDMEDRDVKSIYAYLKHLGEAGQPVPRFVPPGQEPKGPVVRFPG